MKELESLIPGDFSTLLSFSLLIPSFHLACSLLFSRLLGTGCPSLLHFATSWLLLEENIFYFRLGATGWRHLRDWRRYWQVVRLGHRDRRLSVWRNLSRAHLRQDQLPRVPSWDHQTPQSWILRPRRPSEVQLDDLLRLDVHLEFLNNFEEVYSTKSVLNILLYVFLGLGVRFRG